MFVDKESKKRDYEDSELEKKDIVFKGPEFIRLRNDFNQLVKENKDLKDEIKSMIKEMLKLKYIIETMINNELNE